MSEPVRGGGRLRAYLEFLVAFLYYFFAQSLAIRGANGFAGEALSPLLEEAMLVFLLIIGYSAMGFWFDRQADPISEQGLVRRPGWTREAGLGLATGWAVALVCVLPLTVFGGIAVSISSEIASWGWLVADVAFFALWALAEEVAFRGYAFQRFTRALGPTGAALGFAAIYAILQALLPGASHASFAVSFALSLVLSACYLRTRALWLSWGLNFGWKASRALLIGLAVSGNNSHSPVIQGDPMGPFWLTGGAFGLDGSWITFVVLLLALPVVFSLTRDLSYRYNAPVIEPGGIPVDLDAISRSQHDAAMGPAAAVAPAGPALVQIGIAPTAAPAERDKGIQPPAAS